MTTYILLFFVSMMSQCHYQKIYGVPGVYINTNFNYDPFLPEIPYTIDTLILKDDGTFESSFYGNGKYLVEERCVILSYDYEFGKSSFKAPVEVDSKGIPKIILFKPKNHCYIKIE